MKFGPFAMDKAYKTVREVVAHHVKSYNPSAIHALPTAEDYMKAERLIDNGIIDVEGILKEEEDS